MTRSKIDQSLRRVFGRNLKAMRLKKELSQEALAEICGLHRTYVGSVERGERNVSIDNIEVISDALDCKPTKLLDEGVS